VSDRLPAAERAPATADEEIIYAESGSVVSERSDEERLRRVEHELRLGFSELGEIGPAICVFGSARIPEDAPEYRLAREMGRAIGEAGFAARRTLGRSRSASTSSCRTSRRSIHTSTSGSSSTTSSPAS
jgi:hypothetical protein